MTVITTGTRSSAGGVTSEQVWREFGTQLQAFVQRRIADPHRADDVLGEIVLRIHRNLDRVDDHAHLSRWVYRITRNAIIDEYRRAKRDRARRGTLVDDVLESAITVEDEPESGYGELAACMRPLLDRLPAEQRRALELSDLDGLTQADAAPPRAAAVRQMFVTLLVRPCAEGLAEHPVTV